MKGIIKTFCILTLFLSGVSYADIKFWTTEVQPARMEKQMDMAKAFEAKTGIFNFFHDDSRPSTDCHGI